MTPEQHAEELRAEKKACPDAEEEARIEAELEAAEDYLRALFYEELAEQSEDWTAGK